MTDKHKTVAAILIAVAVVIGQAIFRSRNQPQETKE
jgi:hypothetical protein